MDSVRTVVNTVVNWLSPPDKPAGEETPPGAANSTTPLHGTMRDPSAGPSALKRAAPVEDGTLPDLVSCKPVDRDAAADMHARDGSTVDAINEDQRSERVHRAFGAVSAPVLSFMLCGCYVGPAKRR